MEKKMIFLQNMHFLHLETLSTNYHIGEFDNKLLVNSSLNYSKVIFNSLTHWNPEP